MTARMALGSGILRPESAVSIKTAINLNQCHRRLEGD